MSSAYNPYESSAIINVREEQNTSIVDKKFFDKNNDPVYDPRLVLLNKTPIEEQSLQCRNCSDSYNYAKGASYYGGSNTSFPYNNSYDAYLIRSS